MTAKQVSSELWVCHIYLRFKTCSTLAGRNTHLKEQSGRRLSINKDIRCFHLLARRLASS